MWKTEKYATGKYDVIKSDENGEYPRRLGHITGAKSSWFAEAPHKDLGYHKTKKQAVKAIDLFYQSITKAPY